MTCLISAVAIVDVVVNVVVAAVVVDAIVVDSLLSFELNMLTVLVLDGNLHAVLQDGHGGHRLGERRVHPRSGCRSRTGSRTGGPGVRTDVERDGCGQTSFLLGSGRPLKTVSLTCPTSHYTSPPLVPPPPPPPPTNLSWPGCGTPRGRPCYGAETARTPGDLRRLETRTFE